MENKVCIYFGGIEDCYCNNDPDNPGECVYEKGIKPEKPELTCPHYKTLSDAKTGDAK